MITQLNSYCHGRNQQLIMTEDMLFARGKAKAKASKTKLATKHRVNDTTKTPSLPYGFQDGNGSFFEGAWFISLGEISQQYFFQIKILHQTIIYLDVDESD